MFGREAATDGALAGVPMTGAGLRNFAQDLRALAALVELYADAVNPPEEN